MKRWFTEHREKDKEMVEVKVFMHSSQQTQYAQDALQSLDSKVDQLIGHLSILVDESAQPATTAMENGSLQVTVDIVMDAAVAANKPPYMKIKVENDNSGMMSMEKNMAEAAPQGLSL